MEFIKDNQIDILSPSSMGVRITPLDRGSVHNSYLFRMQATSAETNVLNIPASLGMKAVVLTKFVKDSPIATFIKNELRKRNIEYIGKEINQDGPWGFRHQFNIADSGFGLKAPRVCNDRAGEVGRTISYEDFDLDEIFKNRKVKIVHVSGLIAALSETTSNFCLKLVKKAKENGSKVSFDINYRASFWKNREEELSHIFKEIANLSDILIGNEEDFQLALGVKGPEDGGKDLTNKIDSFKEMIKRMTNEYPNCEIFATTLREVISANTHKWGAIAYQDNKFNIIEPKEIDVLDRIGGGDGFVGGLIYALLKGYPLEKSINIGWASGVLACSGLDDFASPIDEKQLTSIFEGNARVVR